MIKRQFIHNDVKAEYAMRTVQLKLPAPDELFKLRRSVQHAIFHCTHPQAVSLRRKCAHMFSQTLIQLAGSLDVSAFLNQDGNKLP